MLSLVTLVEQFDALEHELPERWGTARFRLTPADETRADRAAALLGPANPGRRGNEVRFSIDRKGGGVAPEAARRLLRRLEEEGLGGELELLGVEEAPAEELRTRPKLQDQWEQELAKLPPDWTDLYAQVRLDSTDFLERAALLVSPLNPARYDGPTTLRFRCARTFGYGASPQMVSRCLERCDQEGITGEIDILWALSDTFPVATQGPVWYVGGRAV